MGLANKTHLIFRVCIWVFQLWSQNALFLLCHVLFKKFDDEASKEINLRLHILLR